MKIAAITVTYNDGYKVERWLEHYREHKDSIFLHIIVDNGSDSEYIKTVAQSFPGSVIIKRIRNDGCTAAYNDGIKYALEIKEVDSILLLANDVKISAESISTLHSILFSNEECGIISPICLEKDSDTIEDYGSKITKTLYMNPDNCGDKVTDALPLAKEVVTVIGGLCLAKRRYYELVGLQDENLFMYSDEVDMGIRMSKTNLKALMTRQASAWHQHINPQNTYTRQGYTEFLIRRNKIYLGYKHFGFQKALYIFIKQIIQAPRFCASFLKKRSGILIVYYLLGCFCGILRIQKNFRTIIENRL